MNSLLIVIFTCASAVFTSKLHASSDVQCFFSDLTGIVTYACNFDESGCKNCWHYKHPNNSISCGKVYEKGNNPHPCDE